MPYPAADYHNDQMRWFLEGFSITSLESAMMHLGRGWLGFTPAVAVFIGKQSFAESSACFYRENAPPHPIPKFLLGEKSLDAATENLAEDIGVSDLSPQPAISLQWDQEQVGWVKAWTERESSWEEIDWLKEASARVLSAQQTWERKLLADKVEALAEFAAGAGHEINNPVATISGRTQGLLQNETDPERRRQLLTIGGQALRIRDMIGDTMLFARPPDPKPEPLDLQTVLPEILKALGGELKTAKFSYDIPQPVAIFADRAQFAVVITELLRNSLEWQDNGGTIVLSASPIESPLGPLAEIVIEDDGESFAEADRPHLFDPFYCGRQAGRGLGFGLPKCWRIVSNHHGRMGIASLPVRGTRVTIHWPAYAPSHAPT